MPGLTYDLAPYLDDHGAMLVDHYVHSGCFTGAAFDTLDTGAGNPSGRFTADDLLATAMLRIPIAASAAPRFPGIRPDQALRIVGDEQLAGLLAEVPAHRAMVDLDASGAAAVYGDDAPASRLFWTLREQVGLKRVATFKLLARKRPELLAVRDSVVSRALHPGRAWWPVWWHELVVARPELAVRLEQVRDDARVPLGLLRVADVAVWMRQRGADQCSCGLREQVGPPLARTRAG